jgi:phosphohistidine swiveling domain-containing protein
VVSSQYFKLGQWISPVLEYQMWLDWCDTPEAQELGILPDEKSFVAVDGNFMLAEEGAFPRVRERVFKEFEEGKYEFAKKILDIAKDISDKCVEMARTLPLTTPVSSLDEPFTLLAHIRFPWLVCFAISDAADRYLAQYAKNKSLSVDELSAQVPQLENSLNDDQKKLTYFRKKIEALGLAFDVAEIREKEPQLAKELDEYQSSTEYIGTHHFWGEPRTMERLLEAVSHANKELVVHSKSVPPVELTELFDVISLTTQLRLECAQSSAQLAYVIRKILTPYAENLGLTYNDIVFLTTDEITKLTATTAPQLRPDIKERQKGYAVYKDNHGTTIVVGSELEAMKEKYGLVVDHTATTQISGNIGCKGLVRGIVAVVMIPTDNVKVKTGMILVAPETTPDFIPAMGKAAAFVTDRGGVTSHAAIVAREMQKPCIIGTNIATQVLKDGDLVEVDANTGVVRILEKAPSASELSFTSPELAIFSPKEYEFIGLWKCDLFPAYFWIGWFNKDILKRLDFALQSSASANLFGGNFFYYKPTLEWGREEVQTMLADATGARSRKYREAAENDFREVTAAMDALASLQPGADAIEKINKLSEVLMTYWVTSNLLSPPFDELIAKKAIEEKIPAEDVVGLVPKFSSQLEVQHADAKRLLDLLKAKNLDGMLATDSTKLAVAINADLELKKEFDAHLEKFGWLELLNYVGAPLTLERLLDQIKTSAATPKTAHQLSLHALSIELKHLLQTAADIGFVRQGAAEVSSLLQFKVRRLLEETAEKLGLTYREMLHLIPREISDGLTGRKSKDDLKTLIARRAGGNWFIFAQPGTEKVVVIDDMNDIQTLTKLMLPAAGEDTDMLMGQIGNKGKVQGRVSVIMATDDFHKFKEGNILVTTMTTPDFVILMQKSIAIVTDIGGMLSHASIVSRELGKPCVIGTKFATQILHDGDLVEVDADNGVVKILEKASN